jgi:TonB family protein
MALKKSFSTLSILLIINFLSAQTDTIFYDVNNRIVPNRQQAASYEIEKTQRNTTIFTRYDLADNKLSFQTYRRQIEPPPHFPELVVTGFAGVRTPSKEPPKLPPLPRDSALVKFGAQQEWYPTGGLKMRGSYLNGKLHGLLETFYPNGKLKRQDEYHLDTLKTGHCYDTAGIEIDHIPFFVYPEFKGGELAMFKWMSKIIHYPRTSRERGQTGYVIVEFVVDKEGNIKNVRTKYPQNDDLDAECIGLVQKMPQWNPAQKDGQPISMKLSLPIRFILE